MSEAHALNAEFPVCTVQRLRLHDFAVFLQHLIVDDGLEVFLELEMPEL